MGTEAAKTEQIGVIYIITNRINGRQYIGQTRRSLKSRWNGHCSQARKGSNKPLHRAIAKYGSENFKVATLLTCPIMYLNKAEKFCIQSLKSLVSDGGYNILPGGEVHYRGHQLTDEQRRKLSEAKKGRKFSDEHRRNIGLAARGRKLSENNKRKLLEAHLGKKRLEETKSKISKTLRGRTFSEETISKMRASHLGKTLSDEHKRKVGEAGKGRKCSDETKRKIAASNQGRKISEDNRRKMKEAWVRRKAKAAAEAIASQAETGIAPPEQSPSNPAFQSLSLHGQGGHLPC